MDSAVYAGHPFYSGDPFGTNFSGPAEITKVINPPDELLLPGAVDGFNTRQTSDGGLETITTIWSAQDLKTGDILWQRPLEGGFSIFTNGVFDNTTQPFPRSYAFSYSHITTVNNVLFTGGVIYQTPFSSFVALDGTSGDKIWELPIDPQTLPNAPGVFPILGNGVAFSSPAVVDNVLYWGTGGSFGGALIPPLVGNNETRNNKVYAFELCSEEDLGVKAGCKQPAP